MDFKKLFETQSKLEECINKQHPLKEGENRLAQKILALQVELMECANNWRGFKYWGNYDVPEGAPKTKCDCCDGKGFYDQFNSNDGHWTIPCHYCDGSGLNQLLEEYADVLHFALSVGLELGYMIESVYLLEKSPKTITERFTTLTVGYGILGMQSHHVEDSYRDLFAGTIRLGLKLGFTLEQIEEAYYTKNEINHDRQAVGY